MTKTKILLGSVLFVAFVGTGIYWVKNNRETKPDGLHEKENSNYFLREVADKEVLVGAARPDVAEIGGNLYLAYKDLSSPGDDGFKSIVLGKDLKVVQSSVNIVPDDESIMVTDIRVSADNQNNFWYVYESVFGKAGCGNHLVNGALYGKDLNLKYSKEKLSTGCTSGPQRLNIPTSQIPKDPQIADDPTPFYYNGKYYVLSRAWDGPINHMRVYDSKFNQLEYFTLDISKLFKKDEGLSQNAMVEIEDKVYIIGGIQNGPPMGQNSSYISAIPLSEGLKSFEGQAVKLTNYSEYDTRVTSAKYKDGILYVNYHNLKEYFQYLEAFDVDDGFKSLGRAKFQEGFVGDGHSSFTVLNNNIYLFYCDTKNKIKAKVIEIGDKNEQINIKTTKSTQNQEFIDNQLPQGDAQIPQNDGPTKGRCGDGVCQDIEKSTGFCKTDCK